MRVFICDDTEEVLFEIKRMLETILEIERSIWEIQTFLSAEKLENYSVQTKPADIILMDVRLESESGIEAAKSVQAKYPGTQIIFITGFSETAEDIFEADPCAFLIKPINQSKLYAAMQRAFKCVEEKKEFISFKTKNSVVKLRVGDIDYVESQKRILYINGMDGTKNLYMKLDDFMEAVPLKFLRIHKSYAVNMNKIKKLDSFKVILEDGKILPVSRQKSKEAKTRFLKYCSNEFVSWDENGL